MALVCGSQLFVLQAEDGIRDHCVPGVQTCALPISRPRIVPASHVMERHGIRCVSAHIWTIPESFDQPCRAEIVFLFENQAGELSHRRYELTFQPFSHIDLRQAVESAGFQITGDSFEPAAPFYAIAAVVLTGRTCGTPGRGSYPRRSAGPAA